MRVKFLKFIYIPAIIAGIFSSAQASTSVTLQGVEFKVDTLRHVKVGPGTMLTSLLMTSQSTTKVMRTFALTMDMKGHDNVEYRMEIGRDTTLSTERISSIAQRKSDSNTHYFAGVNADFFITTSYVPQYAGQPHMDCIMNGEIASTGYLAAADYGHFFMDYNKNMWCDNPTQTFTITFPDETVVPLPRINQDIYAGEMVLFNSKYGKQTRVAECTDVQVALAEGESWAVNRPIKLVVTSNPSTAGATPIAQGGAVLSGKSGGPAEKIATLKPGDELIANFNISMQDYGVSPDIKECSGGDVVILKRGEVIYDAIRFINSRDSNNPRTMFGYTEDRSKMVWCLVDGRSTSSLGCTYPEGAEIMKFFGCYDALNVDGGGSSGMYVEALGIVNSPSDGNERAVANGIFAVLNAPEDNEIAEIKFLDYAGKFPKYGIYTPVVYGYNKYGKLIDTDVKGVTLSCPSELGEIVKEGTTLFANGGGTYALTATYGNITTTMPVTIDTSNSPELVYTDVLLDNYRKWAIEIQSLVGEEYMSVSPEALSWTSSDETVATISELGEVVGLKDGTSTLSGVVGDFSGNINLTVECPTANAMPIDNFADVASWKATKSGLGTATLSSGENSSLKADYTITNTRSAKLTLAKTVQVWSLPDKIRVKIKPGNATFSDVSIKATPSNSRVKTISLTGTTIGDEIVYEMPVTELDETNSIGMYPISFGSLVFTVSGATSTNYSFELTGLEGVYDNFTAGVGTISSEYKSNGFYVTPDNILVLGEEVAELFVYTISGQLVEKVTATGNYSLDTLASGIYILNVKTDAGVSAIKFIK